MKKVLLLGAFALFGAMNAQTEKGKWVIDVNTGSHAVGNTAFSLTSVDGSTAWGVGAEGGYFVADKLAVKVGLGYQDAESSDGSFAYKVGAQYYIINKIPVGVDFTGTSYNSTNVNYVGLEGGYAWFVAPNVAVTPKVRYNMTLDENKAPSMFQGLVGFSVFF